jgi:putative FmdB family regulatory protein
MPIFEFKCLECNEFFEILVMNQEDETEMRCPKCKAKNFERVLSNTSFNMGAPSGSNQTCSGAQSHTCSSGSCTTYDIPGPTR